MENLTTLDQACSIQRTEIKKIGITIKSLIETVKANEFKGDKGEIIANVTLAYRHLEDSAMRLGKAIQAYEGGESIYNSNDAQRVASNGAVLEGTYSTPKAE